MPKPYVKYKIIWSSKIQDTVDSRYLEIEGTKKIIRLIRSSTKRNYRKLSFYRKRETTRVFKKYGSSTTSVQFDQLSFFVAHVILLLFFVDYIPDRI